MVCSHINVLHVGTIYSLLFAGIRDPSTDLLLLALPAALVYPTLSQQIRPFKVRVCNQAGTIFTGLSGLSMPRFLDTVTGDFVWKNGPQDFPYAILSHTWRLESKGGEQSYAEVCAIQNEVYAEVWKQRKLSVAVVQEIRTIGATRPSALGYAPRRTSRSSFKAPTRLWTIFAHPKLSKKVLAACRHARRAGYWLLWIDACCIDKSSSAELSEAINSMYDWYRLADVCYVYLADVPHGQDPTRKNSRFRRSRWHTRGWTLQELIAPERVEFLTRTWTYLGTKMGLATTLEEITGIDFDVLAGRVTDLDTISIAKRMSWAARRDTTHVEDQAYCLMGLFCVNMPPIYGEESNAFLRLQKEIVNGIPDQSIFAWGESCTLRSSREGAPGEWWTSSPALLADAPFSFAPARDIAPLAIEDFASRLHRRPEEVPPLHCVFTPQGIRVQLLCVDLTLIPHVFDTIWAIRNNGPCNDCMRLGHAHALGLLRCEDAAGSLVALPLCQPTLQEPKDESGLDIAVHKMCKGAGHYPFRVVRLTKEALTEMLPYVSPAPVEVSLRMRQHKGKKLDTTKVTFKSLYATFSIARGLNLWPGDRAGGVAIQYSPVSVDQLCALGFTFSPILCTRTQHEITTVASLTSGTDTGSQHTIRLQISLTSLSKLDAGLDTRACFSAESTISRCHEPDLDGIGPSDGLHALYPDVHHSRLSNQAGPSTRVTSHFSHLETAQRVVAHAEFIMPSPTRMGATDDAPAYKLLLVKLERPLSSAEIADRTNLWLSVEMSQTYVNL